MSSNLATGLPELDALIHGLIVGDNVVWKVDDVNDYRRFVDPLVRWAVDHGRKLVYFRFASHPPLIDARPGVTISEHDPAAGFETFLDGIHDVIEQTGRGAYYVFDCLSQLAAAWFSDGMLGNFFRLTCPFLYDMETIAYFALTGHYHSHHALGPIRDTTQLLLDVYHNKERVYLRPLKVQQRYSPTMHMLHVWEDGHFRPLTDSWSIAEVMNPLEGGGVDAAISRLDVWNRAFHHAEDVVRAIEAERPLADSPDAVLDRLLRMVVSRDERILELARRFFSVKDVLAVGRRTIGTGLIGGKAVGMLLARAIVNQRLPRWRDLLEVHDSFFIASDTFYSYLVRNGCWWLRQSQKNPDTYLEGAQQARRRILTGDFSPEIEAQLLAMLDYFGESPIIVRSSSLLEDNFGNSFAGKYESVFCPNQGSRHQRLENLVAAIKTIYASSISEGALHYRARHGILDKDEQMALLVQRVSGRRHRDLFYPDTGGVGFSFNLFAWNEDIDPTAGMLRLVYGLGTRAVDRIEDDYTRIIALNAPDLVPGNPTEGGHPYAQHKVDVLDLSGNHLVTKTVEEVFAVSEKEPLKLFTSTDLEAARRARESGRNDAAPPRILTFKELLRDTPFVDDMREMLQAIQEAYGCPVDVEFTANFQPDKQYKVNIVQCRPLQVREDDTPDGLPEGISEDDVLLKSTGPVIGHSQLSLVDRFIYVVPAAYAALPMRDKYAVARLIGKLTRHPDRPKKGATMLLGPGRWGTSTPELGVTVSFAEIETVNILCEIVEMREGLVPEVSYGTHFFSELIEMDMLYMALSPASEGNFIRREYFENGRNKLLSLVPEAEALESVVKVIEIEHSKSTPVAKVYANTIEQRVVSYQE